MPAAETSSPEVPAFIAEHLLDPSPMCALGSLKRLHEENDPAREVRAKLDVPQPKGEAERDVTKLIEAYADLVLGDGFYLSQLDMFLLLGCARGKQVASFIIDNEAGPAVEPVSMQTTMAAMSGLEFDNIIEKGCSASETCCFALCAADFKPRPMLSLNHFVPLWSAQQVPKDVFQAAEVQARDSCAARLSDLDVKIADAQKQSEGRFEEENQQVMASLLAEKASLKAEEEFLKFLSSKDMVPKLVPADGNCGPWTVLYLQHGLGAAIDPTKEDMLQVRRATWLEWRETSHQNTPNPSKPIHFDPFCICMCLMLGFQVVEFVDLSCYCWPFCRSR